VTIPDKADQVLVQVQVLEKQLEHWKNVGECVSLESDDRAWRWLKNLVPESLSRQTTNVANLNRNKSRVAAIRNKTIDDVSKRFWITLPKNHFTKKLWPKGHLTKTPFDHLTEHCLTECHLTESKFDRIAV
jgi:hypothetical protein